MVAQTRKGGKPSPKKFKFNEKLVGKGLTTDALLKKLKVVQSDLAELDQDDADRKTLEPICKELTSSSILLHKDKGVKAYAACCLADLLRLFAPDAPLTAAELRDIFQFFFHQVSQGLKGSDSPYYNQYVHLLESLSTVKSVVLVCDLPQADELMTTIFRTLFNLVRNDLPKNIEMFISDIAVALIDECQLVPQDVLEIIMAQFMDKNARLDQPAYRLAVDVCKATADKLQRNVCQYFTDNIVQHAQAEDFEEVERCHALIKQLNHACPALLHNVVPQLEEELRVEEVQLRQMATHVLGEMFADNVGGDLEKKYPSTWTYWLARKNDKAVQVRLAFVEGCKGLLSHQRLELREAVEDALNLKLQDPDEKVRAAVCKLYSQLDYETALHYVSEKQLRAVGERSIDKKQIVRQESLSCIGRLYSVAYPEIENNVSAAVKHFAWIPQQICTAIHSVKEVKTMAVQIISDFILPLPSKGDDEEVAWTDRLLTVMRHLDEKGVSTLVAVSNFKVSRPSPCDRFIDVCVENNGGIIDADEQIVKRKLAAITRVVSSLFSEPLKVADDLKAFADLNEQRLYKLAKTCLDPHTDLKGLVKSINEFSRRIQQSSPSIHTTMMSFIRQGSLWIINTSSIPTLVKRLQKGDSSGRSNSASHVQVAANHSQTLLTTMSKHSPAVYRPHVGELTKAIADEKHPRLVEVCLQALAAVCKHEPSVTPVDKRTVERLNRYARGSEARHAKFATRTLTQMKEKETLCSDLVEYVTDRLSTAEPDELVAYIAVLVEIVRTVPEAFEQKSDVIVTILLKTVLLQPSFDAESMELDEEWMEETNLPDHAKAKILVLKLCRHRCLAHSESESAMDIAAPVLQMLFAILQNGGTLTENDIEDPRVKSRLRLQAALSLTRLSTVEKFAEKVAPNFVLLAVTIQDSCFNVRLGFLDKLMPLIHIRKLHPRFNVVMFLTVHDPEEEVKSKARSFVIFQYRKETPEGRLAFWENIFVRLLHALAHHPDFGLEEQNVSDLSKYINFYLSLIAHANNISLLYHLAQKCKTVRDADSHTFSEHLYALSELAQELIRGHARSNQWSLDSYPGKVKLPADIFRALPGLDAGKTILKTVYLPEHVLKAIVDTAAAPARERQKVEKKRKATENGKSNGAPKRPRGRPRKKRATESDEDEDGSVEEVSDEEKRATSSAPGSVVSGSEEGEDGENGDKKEEDLGRGARSRAKVKAKRKVKSKPKSNALSSDDQ